MAPVRLRHPNGVTTLEIDFEQFTVLDLQQEIYAATDIPPSLQDLKSGYPPHTLTLIPELPLESLGIQKGDQIIVTQKASMSPTPRVSTQSSGVSSSSISRPAASTTPSQRLHDVFSSPVPTMAPSSSPSGPDYVEMDGSYLIHRVVPDDNSCLFSSVALIFEQDISKASSVRKIVAEEIRKDFVTWTDAILGRPRDDYVSTILKPSSWGGAIELSILAAYYSTEIASIDVETGRIDHFTPSPERDAGNRCVLIYSGIHYDAATIAPILDAPPDFHQTVVPVTRKDDSDPVLVAAKKLADILRSKKAYTNTATFDLKCEVCGKGLKGEKEARAHASETGHVKFGEYTA